MLIVEDGTVVPNANTFITDAEFTDYADARGITYPLTAEDREPLIIKAVDYLQSLEKKFTGWRTEPTNQTLVYPRTGVYLYCVLLGSDAIPQELKNAQCEAALYENSGELLTQTSQQNIASEKLGDLEVSYHSGGSYSHLRLDRVDAYLDPLLKQADGKTVRF
jgi:hypothetical protein